MLAQIGETFVRRALQGLREGDAPEPPELDGSRAPVVLLHGFGVTSAVLRPLEARIRRSTGRPCLRLRLGCRLPLHLADVRRSARRVERALDRLARRTSFGRVDVVGHSLGGLVATYWLKRIDQGRRIRRVITLGTPHRGTPYAALGVLLLGAISPAVWQMLPGSGLVRELAALPVPEGSELVALGSHDDAVVPASLALPRPAPRLRAAAISRASHIELLWSRDVSSTWRTRSRATSSTRRCYGRPPDGIAARDLHSSGGRPSGRLETPMFPLTPRPRTRASVALLACLALAAPALSDHAPSELSLATAKQLMAKAEATAASLGAPGAAIAIVDDGGHLVLLERLDGTFPAAATVSTEKARTAAVFRMPTENLENAIKNGRSALLGVAVMTPLQGGVPIRVHGRVIGAVGVSGAASAAQDTEIASAVAASLE